MIEKVVLTPATSVLEIGCGDGFLTSAILNQSSCARLQVYEIDPEWAAHVQKKITDPRLTITLANILDVDLTAALGQHTPWVMLANLPYHITFPILFLVQAHKELFQEGVVMVQEEVAQKIVASHGKGYSPTSMFLQHHFEWKLMEKIEPTAFVPPPKVSSRLLYFKPRTDAATIPDESAFWKFLKLCFRSPRQTLRNNLKSTHYITHTAFNTEILDLRAQQFSFAQFLELWEQIRAQRPQ